MNVLSGLCGAYSVAILIRIILAWFKGGQGYGKVYAVLCSVTDPYLDWFHRFPILRTSLFDFSPIAALGVLSLVNNIFFSLANYGRITIGIILAMILSLLWSVIAFVAGFYLIVLLIRLFAYVTNRDILSPFWSVVDRIAQPAIFQVSRLIFRGRQTSYTGALCTSLGAIFLVRLGGGIGVGVLQRLLSALPF
jgi:YggT family protein